MPVRPPSLPKAEISKAPDSTVRKNHQQIDADAKQVDGKRFVHAMMEGHGRKGAGQGGGHNQEEHGSARQPDADPDSGPSDGMGQENFKRPGFDFPGNLPGVG